MELAAKYAYEVYQRGSFSKAAAALYISQPALSSMIAKLERELGFKVFDRRSSPITLTPKGQIYVQMLEEVLNSEAAMYKRLQQFSKRHTKQLGVGVSIFNARYIMPEVSKKMLSLYPDIQIKFDMGEKGGTRVLSAHLSSKIIDTVIGYNYDKKTQTSIPIAETKYLVAARRDLLGIEGLLPYAMNRTEALRADTAKEIDSTKLHLFSDVPFITSDPYTGYHNKVAALTANNYSLSNVSITNIRTMATNFEMMRAGLGATIVNNIQLINPLFDDDQIVYFSTFNSTATRTLSAVFRNEDEPSEEALHFVEIFKEALTEKINAIIES